MAQQQSQLPGGDGVGEFQAPSNTGFRCSSPMSSPSDCRSCVHGSTGGDGSPGGDGMGECQAPSHIGFDVRVPCVPQVSAGHDCVHDSITTPCEKLWN